MFAMLAQGVLALSLVVRVYNAGGMSSTDLARARVAVERIMTGAGVAVAWTPCPCPMPVSGEELVVRIIDASPSSEPASLGFSYIDVERRRGTLATVFADRVRALANRSGIDTGELLGRAIAHEMSHLVLGTREHGHHGLMRGRWTAVDLSTRGTKDWTLSRTERRQIRQAIARRAIESAQPAAVAADAAPLPEVSAQ